MSVTENASKLRYAAELLNQVDCLVQEALRNSHDTDIVVEAFHTELENMQEELCDAAEEMEMADEAWREEVRAHALSKLTDTERMVLGV